MSQIDLIDARPELTEARRELTEARPELTEARSELTEARSECTETAPESAESRVEGAGSLPEFVAGHRVESVVRWLDEHPPHRIADELARMDAVLAGVAFRLLDKEQALAVFEELEPVDQQQILQGLRDQS